VKKIQYYIETNIWANNIAAEVRFFGRYVLKLMGISKRIKEG